MLRATMKIPSSLALECTFKKMPASLTDGTIRKTLSISATNTKRFIINDHYEFDQKVNNNIAFIKSVFEMFFASVINTCSYF